MTTLRQDYFDSATGLNAQLVDAFTNGGLLITSNLLVISPALISAANQGSTTFKVTLVTTFKPSALRLKGLLLDSYLAGVTAALAVQNIFSFECVPTLNTSAVDSTSIDLNFDFKTT